MKILRFSQCRNPDQFAKQFIGLRPEEAKKFVDHLIINDGTASLIKNDDGSWELVEHPQFTDYGLGVVLKVTVPLATITEASAYTSWESY